MIPSLAEMLLGEQIPALPVPENKPTAQVSRIMECYARNADLPCSNGCSKPRHISRTGKCYTTLCTDCYKAAAKIKRQKEMKKRKVGKKK